MGTYVGMSVLTSREISMGSSKGIPEGGRRKISVITTRGFPVGQISGRAPEEILARTHESQKKLHLSEHLLEQYL